MARTLINIPGMESLLINALFKNVTAFLSSEKTVPAENNCSSADFQSLLTGKMQEIGAGVIGLASVDRSSLTEGEAAAAKNGEKVSVAGEDALEDLLSGAIATVAGKDASVIANTLPVGGQNIFALLQGLPSLEEAISGSDVAAAATSTEEKNVQTLEGRDQYKAVKSFVKAVLGFLSRGESVQFTKESTGGGLLTQVADLLQKEQGGGTSAALTGNAEEASKEEGSVSQKSGTDTAETQNTGALVTEGALMNLTALFTAEAELQAAVVSKTQTSLKADTGTGGPIGQNTGETGSGKSVHSGTTKTSRTEKTVRVQAAAVAAAGMETIGTGDTGTVDRSTSARVEDVNINMGRGVVDAVQNESISQGSADVSSTKSGNGKADTTHPLIDETIIEVVQKRREAANGGLTVSQGEPELVNNTSTATATNLSNDTTDRTVAGRAKENIEIIKTGTHENSFQIISGGVASSNARKAELSDVQTAIKVEASTATVEEKSVKAPAGENADKANQDASGGNNHGILAQHQSGTVSTRENGALSGKATEKAGFAATLADKIEKITEQYANKSSSMDMVLRLKIDEKETLLVGFKDQGSRISVEVKTTNESVANFLASQKDEIVKQLEQKSIHTSIYVDVQSDSPNRRDQRERKPANHRTDGKEDFSVLMEDVASA